MKFLLLSVASLFVGFISTAQVKADLKAFKAGNGTAVTQQGQLLEISWPAGNALTGKIVFDLDPSRPLFKEIILGDKQVSSTVDPAVILITGKRDLLSQNGWNIFFDKVPNKHHESYPLSIKRNTAAVKTEGSRTI